jgi:virginiamycin B lyase
MPGGADSRPYGMAVDRSDTIWIVETGISPNRFVGFDAATEEFVNMTDIPSGGGAVRHMDYFAPAGEIWFGTDTNYIGRAKVH